MQRKKLLGTVLYLHYQLYAEITHTFVRAQQKNGILRLRKRREVRPPPETWELVRRRLPYEECQ